MDSPELEELDEEHITYMESHVVLKYNYNQLERGSYLNLVRARWLQAFGSSERFAASIEVPFTNFNGTGQEPSTGGIGDLQVEFSAMLSKRERFEQAVGVQLTLPSASSNVIGEGQTVLRMMWGFSTPLTKHTLLSGEVGYNKTISDQTQEPGANFIEPELILAQTLGKRMGVFLDWDTYYDFNPDQYIQTLKTGFDIQLDHKEKWSLTPYATFPLNSASRAMEFRYSVGCDLIFKF